jgi:uncharacterized protein (TIGR03435 family)
MENRFPNRRNECNWLLRGTVRLLALIASVGVSAPAQTTPSQGTASTSAAFEVASIRPHPLASGQFVFHMSKLPGPPLPSAEGNRFNAKIVTLQDIIMQAYGVMDYQIVGIPDWGQPRGEHYDIAAKAEGDGTPTTDELRVMLQKLLTDRFHLVIHKEKRELPVYALVIGKNGPKVREVSEAEIMATQTTTPSGGTARASGDAPALMRSTIDPQLLGLLSNLVDRPIIDQTALKGMVEYQNLDWLQLGREHREDPVAGMASVFAAVQNQLGLKLEPRKEPLEVVVIDHAEKPSAN